MRPVRCTCSAATTATVTRSGEARASDRLSQGSVTLTRVSREQSLLASIEADALSGAPVADALRKCIALGGRAGSAELQAWASRELRGYPLDAEVPPYRMLPATLTMLVTSPGGWVRQTVQPEHLPPGVRDVSVNELRLRQGVGELEAMVPGDGPLTFTMGSAGAAAALIQRQSARAMQHVMDVYWLMDRAAVAGLLDQIRTSLVEFVAALARRCRRQLRCRPPRRRIGHCTWR